MRTFRKERSAGKCQRRLSELPADSKCRNGDIHSERIVATTVPYLPERHIEPGSYSEEHALGHLEIKMTNTSAPNSVELLGENERRTDSGEHIDIVVQLREIGAAGNDSETPASNASKLSIQCEIEAEITLEQHGEIPSQREFER